MGTVYNTNVVTDGLISCWDAANRRSYPGTGTTWTDIAGSNDGTLVNGPSFSSVDMGYIHFDSSDDQCRLTGAYDSFIDLGSSATIDFWYQVYQANHGQLPLGRGDTHYLLYWDFSGSTVTVYIKNSANSHASMGSFNISDYFQANNAGNDVWHHFAVTQDGGTALKIYFDGELKATNSISSGNFTFNTISGKWASGGGVTFEWKSFIALLHAYNRTLSGDEIKQNYNATKGRFS